MHSKEFAGNLGNQFWPIIAAQEPFDWFSWGWKKKNQKIGEKKSKWPTQKTEFFNSANSQYLWKKFQGLVLGLVG